MESSFEEQIFRADIIFVGTVAAVEPVSLPATAVTYYRFDRVRYLKGTGPTDSLVLAQRGGNDIFVDEEVSFWPGARYVVFATREAPVPGHYHAMMCGTGHPFGIWPDSGSTEPIIHTNLGMSVIAFDGPHLVALWDKPWRPDMGVWAIDEHGIPRPPNPPPNGPLSELIRAADLELRRRSWWLTSEQIDALLQRVRIIHIFPHQDPGSRVGEEDFARTLSNLIARVGLARSPYRSPDN